MSEDDFTTALQTLIQRARDSEAIPLERLVGLIDVELEGLQMAMAEGETL